MPYFKKRRAYKKRSVKNYARGGKKSSVVSSAVKKYVKRTIHKNIENKKVQYVVNKNFGSVVASADMNIFPMMPLTGSMIIEQNITQSGRVGNSINVRKCTLAYTLFPKPYDATTNAIPVPLEVQFFLGHVKRYKGTLPTASDMGYLFQSGSSSSAPAGVLADLIAPINTDHWRIFKTWRHKLGYANYTGTGNQATFQSMNNNDFKLNYTRKMDITKYCPKTVKFDDNLNTSNSNGLYLFYQCVSAVGSTLNAVTLPANINFEVNLDYEDS
jgi:hypothetical protein